MQCSTSGRPAAGVLQRTSPATSVRVAALLRGVHANERRNLASVLSTKAGAPCGELNRSSIEEHSAAELQLDRPGPSSCIAGTVAALHAVAAVELLDILQPAHAQASEALSGSSFELFSSFLDQIEALGPYGPLLFVVTVMITEMIPLFPTQPLSLASGLLFGPQKGALLMLLGVCLAAFNAYSLARGFGRSLAQKVIATELGHGDGSAANPVQQKLAEVQAAIEGGGFWRQLAAIVVLRLTPVVPFSASNYVLGLTPVSLPAFLCGTVVGMSGWAAAYASLGGASRALLRRGMNMEELFADLAERSGRYTQEAATLGAVAGGALLVYFAVTSLRQRGGEQPDGGSGNGADKGGGAAAGGPAAGPAGGGNNPSRRPAPVGSSKELLQRK